MDHQEQVSKVFAATLKINGFTTVSFQCESIEASNSISWWHLKLLIPAIERRVYRTCALLFRLTKRLALGLFTLQSSYSVSKERGGEKNRYYTRERLDEKFQVETLKTGLTSVTLPRAKRTKQKRK